MEALIAQYQKAIQLRALNLYSQHGMKQMKITAEKLAKKPAQAYREADKGNTVTINHDRYPDKVFELTARERRTLIDTSFDSMSFDRIKNRLPESIDENGNSILTWVSPFKKDDK